MDNIAGAPGGMGSMDEIDLSDFRTPEPPPKYDYDLIIIGSGPAGQKAAMAAAKNNANVALVERDPLAGGVCLNTGTIPSKSFREAVLYLTGYRQRGYYGGSYRLKDKVSAGDLLDRTNHVIRMERSDINEQLVHNNVSRLVGTARLAGPTDVVINLAGMETHYRAPKIIIATGTRTRRPDDVPFDELNVFDSDSVFGQANDLRPLPDNIIVLGAGVIGIEYASMFAALEIPTILIDPRENPLSFVDNEIAAVLYSQLKNNGVNLIFGANYKKITVEGDPKDFHSRVHVELTNGETVSADSLLFALGRVPTTDNIGLSEAGVALDKRGYVIVDQNTYETNVPGIYAAGDVIGFPSLASTSAEQGRVAAMGALGLPVTWHPESIPYGIYTIPEISQVGKTEQQLIEEKVEYYVGTGLWRDTARGKIVGDLTGALKMIFTKSDNRLVGVHIIGEGATELLHIGQAVMHFGGGADYFVNTVFNYPTLAEAYKIAARNALNRLIGKAHHTAPLPQQLFSDAYPVDWIKWTPTPTNTPLPTPSAL
ncbi:Si-specific NAD(P)(+) transhydrogenase [soil metagenome]